MSKLGVYYALEHDRNSDWDYMQRLQPDYIRLLEPDASQISRVHQEFPNAVILPRFWGLDDDHGRARRELLANPIKAGNELAERQVGHLETLKDIAIGRGLPWPDPDQLVVNFVNEGNQGATMHQVAIGSVTFVDRCTTLGQRCSAAVLGVGWPADLHDGKPDWRPFINAGLEKQIWRNNGFLELHEYWQQEGPDKNEDVGWLALRHLSCPLDVPILIGECGVDGAIHGRHAKNIGWQGLGVSPAEYARQLAWYLRNVGKRVVAVLPFLTDYRAAEWANFDTGPAHAAILNEIAQQPEPDNGNSEPGGPTEPEPGAWIMGRSLLPLFERYGEQYKVPWYVLAALAYHESAYDPHAISSAGAEGLMQFMPGTWEDAKQVTGVVDPFDPEDSIHASAWYLDWLRRYLSARNYGTWPDWLAGYNAGPGRVINDAVPAITWQYAQNVLILSEALRRWETQA